MIRDLRIYINECHVTCLTCDGDKIDNCLSCFNDINSYYDSTKKRCFGLNGYIFHKHGMVSKCPDKTST